MLSHCRFSLSRNEHAPELSDPLLPAAYPLARTRFGTEFCQFSAINSSLHSKKTCILVTKICLFYLIPIDDRVDHEAGDDRAVERVETEIRPQ